MTPKEKAKELSEKYYNALYEKVIDISDRMQLAKQCAMIVVNEILFALKMDINDPTAGSVKYWQKVKEEIEKL